MVNYHDATLGVSYYCLHYVAIIFCSISTALLNISNQTSFRIVLLHIYYIPKCTRYSIATAFQSAALALIYRQPPVTVPAELHRNFWCTVLSL
jgi:hypothetical protein